MHIDARKPALGFNLSMGAIMMLVTHALAFDISMKTIMMLVNQHLL